MLLAGELVPPDLPRLLVGAAPTTRGARLPPTGTPLHAVHPPSHRRSCSATQPTCQTQPSAWTLPPRRRLPPLISWQPGGCSTHKWPQWLPARELHAFGCVWACVLPPQSALPPPSAPRQPAGWGRPGCWGAGHELGSSRGPRALFACGGSWQPCSCGAGMAPRGRGCEEGAAGGALLTAAARAHQRCRSHALRARCRARPGGGPGVGRGRRRRPGLLGGAGSGGGGGSSGSHGGGGRGHGGSAGASRARPPHRPMDRAGGQRAQAAIAAPATAPRASHPPPPRAAGAGYLIAAAAPAAGVCRVRWRGGGHRRSRLWGG